MKFEAESVITKIVLWCTILNQKTLKSFYFVIIYQNFYIYRIEIGEVAPQSKCVRETLRFMFRSKRTSLIKRLWKLRIRNEHETSCQTEEFELEPEGCFSNTESNSEGCGCCNSRASNTEILVRTNLLKKLEEHQLEMLIQAVESKGADLSACILLPRDNAGTTAVDPHVLSCQVWRWPGLRESNQMRRLPGCRSAKDPVYTCCNPYHWSRLCQPGELFYILKQRNYIEEPLQMKIKENRIQIFMSLQLLRFKYSREKLQLYSILKMFKFTWFLSHTNKSNYKFMLKNLSLLYK